MARLFVRRPARRRLINLGTAMAQAGAAATSRARRGDDGIIVRLWRDQMRREAASVANGFIAEECRRG